MNTSSDQETAEMLEGYDEASRRRVLAHIEDIASQAQRDGKPATQEFLQSIAVVIKKSLLACVAAMLLMSAASIAPSLADAAKTTPPEVLQHLNTDKFEEIKSTADFPESVKSHFTKNAGGKDISKLFADPNGSFAAGCNQMEGGPPGRRLITGAKSKHVCVLYFETGGIALVDSAQVFKLNGKNCEQVWSSSMFRSRPKNMEQLLKAVKERIKG